MPNRKHVSRFVGGYFQGAAEELLLIRVIVKSSERPHRHSVFEAGLAEDIIHRLIRVKILAGECDKGGRIAGKGRNQDFVENVAGFDLTLKGCIEESMPFRGVLFLGLMMTPAGPRLLEYNVRFGDPETQAILVRLESDLAEICEAVVEGTIGSMDVRWSTGASACVILAAEGYPGKPVAGDQIVGVDNAATVPHATVFHAGTALGSDGKLVTSGGRVLGVAAAGSDLRAALATAYSAVDLVSFRGMQVRRDIGAGSF